MERVLIDKLEKMGIQVTQTMEPKFESDDQVVTYLKHFLKVDVDRNEENKKILLCYLNWCMHCHTLILSEEFSQLCDYLKERGYMIMAIDVASSHDDENRIHEYLNNSFGISSYPTFVTIDNKRLVPKNWSDLQKMLPVKKGKMSSILF